MTSPVDTSVKYFSSLMANAPVLSGTAGALVALLDACLKDGFDTKTLTSLVVAGGVATATFTGTHSALVDCVVLIAGVTGGPTGWADLNGEQKVVTKPGATSVTFATALPDGTATGTVTMKMAPLGWLKSYTGTNKGAYKSNDPASTGCYLRVDDAGTTSARVVGYETMSDVDTGTGPFPSVAQMSGGGYWTKSRNANSTAVQWSLHGDGRTFYLNVQPGTSTAAGQQVCANRGFGDGVPLKPGGDPYLCFLNYSTTATVDNQFDGSLGSSFELLTATPRGYTGLGSSALHCVQPFTGATGTNIQSGVVGTLGAFPSDVDGALWLSPKFIARAGSLVSPRGVLPGFFHCSQSGMWDSFRLGDRAPGTGTLAGRTLIAATGAAGNPFSAVSSSLNTGLVFLDATGPWW